MSRAERWSGDREIDWEIVLGLAAAAAARFRGERGPAQDHKKGLSRIQEAGLVPRGPKTQEGGVLSVGSGCTHTSKLKVVPCANSEVLSLERPFV